MKKFPLNFQPHKKGLNSVFGDLESAIMALIWREGPLTVRQVRQALAVDRELAYTTVMTVMSRLADKGVLKKEKEGAAFRYRAAVSEDEFKRSALNAILSSLLGDFGDPVISQFVEAVGREQPDRMDELARLVAERRGKQKS